MFSVCCAPFDYVDIYIMIMSPSSYVIVAVVVIITIVDDVVAPCSKCAIISTGEKWFFGATRSSFLVYCSMAEVLFRAKLQREQGAHTPWGFRLQGGVEYNKPLTLLKVSVGDCFFRRDLFVQILVSLADHFLDYMLKWKVMWKIESYFIDATGKDQPRSIRNCYFWLDFFNNNRYAIYWWLMS